MDDKLRLVLLGHRRIKITGIAPPEEERRAEGGEAVEQEEGGADKEEQEKKTEVLMEETYDVMVDRILKVRGFASRLSACY